ncbi:hypothetical protein B0H16DRAFT_432443 [Mycena metata]|uniref:Uncharacterized protein n=1 Tax=Mycena metata TaxID=1033252 RepID=A0AAD7NL14_9AGAR|nr:hypothetical protein B0H16DRAFT_432443 [Mycena metata]
MCWGCCPRAFLLLYFSFFLFFFSSFLAFFFVPDNAFTPRPFPFRGRFRGVCFVSFRGFWRRGLPVLCLWARFCVPEFLDWRPVRPRDLSQRMGRETSRVAKYVLPYLVFPCAGLLTHGRCIHGEAFAFGGNSVFCAYFLFFLRMRRISLFFWLFLEAGMYFPPSSSPLSGCACAACCYVFFRERKHGGQYQ